MDTTYYYLDFYDHIAIKTTLSPIPAHVTLIKRIKILRKDLYI